MREVRASKLGELHVARNADRFSGGGHAAQTEACGDDTFAHHCAGRQKRAGLMSTTGVPSMASMGPMRRRCFSILRTVTRWRPIGLGRSGERVAKTPVSRRLGSERG